MQDAETNWLNDPTIPAAIRDALRSGVRLERIELDSEGRFWHEGAPLDDARIEALFHRSIQRTAGGSYLLVIPPFSYPLVVRDMPYRVTQVAIESGSDPTLGAGPGRVRLRLDDDSEEDLAIDTLRHEPGRGFACLVKGGSMPARFSRPSYYALAEYVEESAPSDGKPDDLVLVLGGVRHPIPRA